MLKGIMVFLLVMMALLTSVEVLVEGSAGYRFSGRFTKHSAEIAPHAIYEPWNWSPNATLQFYFQTNAHKDALIFHQDGPDGRDQFMDLFVLKDQGARFRAKIGEKMEKHAKRFIEHDFVDSQWHKVKIELSEKEIIFSIDDIRPTEPSITFTKNDESSLNGPLYVAGIPMGKGRKWSYPRLFDEVFDTGSLSLGLFEGCIGDIRINRSPNGRLERAKIRKRPADADESCYGACAAHSCFNGGRCIDKIREKECDCSGTGFEGERCRKESTVVLMNVHKSGGYISQRLEDNSPFLSTERNSIDFMFLTEAKDGLIFYMGQDKDYLLVQLVNGSMRVRANFGKDPVVLETGKNTLSDSCWHYVEIRRKRTRLTVILDRGNTGKATGNASGTFVTLNLNNQSNVIYYGGAPPEILRSAKVKPVSFKGFLKQFRFEEFNVLDNALLGDKGFSITDTDRVKRAWPASNWLLYTAESQCKAAEGSTSGCSPSEDDSDSCKPSSIPTEGTTRSTTPSSTLTTPKRNLPKPQTQSPEMQQDLPTPRPKGVSAWVIILIVLAAMIVVLISVFILYRWNHRYTGSFKPGKNEEGQPQEPGAEAEHQSTRVYNQPAFFVYKPPKKAAAAQSPPVSI